jgi:alkaline phosphatase D
MARSTRRLFLARAIAAGAAFLARRVTAVLTGRRVSAGVGASAISLPRSRAALTHGPFLGDLSPGGAKIWARCAEEGRYLLVARGEGAEVEAVADARREADRTVVWSVSGLDPGARYRYEIRKDGRTIFSEPGASFVTAPPQGAPTVVRLAIGSCAREAEGDRAVWRRMASLDPHAIVLLGDTPYIDSTDLAVQRARYGEFAAVPEFASLLRTRPLYATWDDHDFGANDSDGRLEGKDNARQAFVEYHANPSYGDGREGIYTKFRMGGAEVFLLDTRYFAGTEPSPIAEGPSLLGRGQWAWLRDGLRSSDAPFKLLASGLVWNGAVRPGKPDHWESYAAERDAIFRFIGEERISGVVLVGGDVHRTRVLRYDTSSVVGYALTELITSPMHDGVIPTADVPHPALVHDSGEPHAFLAVTVDTTVGPARLLARFQNAGGRELYSLTLDAADLAAG